MDEISEEPMLHLGSVSSIEEIRDRIIRVYGSEIEKYAQLVDKRKQKPVRVAINYVADHYTEQISLEDTAAVVGLNPAYFSSLFTKQTGQNFSDYVILYKIKKACDYLAEGEMNINEIADHLGFSDARYFSKVFKKKMGIKPTEYKKIYG